jgi:GNAT superfamily N-acetyltransferase
VSLKITGDDGEEVAQGEVGEVRIAGPSVFEGYHGLPEQTEAAIGDGWMHTGDLGFLDDDGYVTLVGRRSDLIISGGLNVYPPEVEAVLRTLDGIDEVAVFGVPHPDLGEQVRVAVVGEVSDEALISHARATLAPFKCPRRVHRVDELPRNAMGKVQKKVLRERYAPPEVREATAADAELLVAGNLALAAQTEGLSLDPDTVQRGVAAVLEGSVDARYLVAERGGRPVGQLMLTTEWSDWRATTVWWVQSVYVLPEARRTGVYRALYDAVVQRARREGIAGVRLYVDRRNHTAMATYEALGMDGAHYALYEHLFESTP